jgi:hypothetical protein
MYMCILINGRKPKGQSRMENPETGNIGQITQNIDKKKTTQKIKKTSNTNPTKNLK